jgi:hypothetical protein
MGCAKGELIRSNNCRVRDGVDFDCTREDQSRITDIA